MIVLALVMYVSHEHEKSPLDGQLDIAAPLNLPTSADTLWFLMKHWCRKLNHHRPSGCRRDGVTDQQIVAGLQREIDIRLGAKNPVLMLHMTFFDIRPNRWRDCRRCEDMARVRFVHTEGPLNVLNHA